MVETNVRGTLSADVLAIRKQLRDRGAPVHAWKTGSFDFTMHAIGSSVWLVLTDGGTEIALRAVHDAIDTALTVNNVNDTKREVVIDCASSAAAHRIKLSSRTHGPWSIVRCTSSILPINDLLLADQGRDLFLLPASNEDAEPNGRIYSMQDGFQTGAIFGAVQSPRELTFLYLQNFTSLCPYFEQTRTTPQATVGGTWPELGFRLPVNSSQKLLASNEYVVSDVYFTVRRTAPHTDGDAAEFYLDGLAATIEHLEPVPTSFHMWPSKAVSTVFDLSHSPLCRREVNGRRYLAPYVDDKTKPPESMVQLTVLAALKEYEAWSGRPLNVARELADGLSEFWNDEIGTVVRWLPGERFKSREDEHQTHEAMDSWYLYHVLFNLARLAQHGVAGARSLLKKSLPYAVRVARRFAYRWPIFFNLKTLDILQAEASPGTGGENDVSGLYALVMLHAHELFEEQEYLDEAIAAVRALEGLGFSVLYQTNSTGFAAEALLRLYLLTGEDRYRKLSNICIANIFAMMAIWDRKYGYGHGFSTFFSLYPLRGAPYVAAYEELETLAKFCEYLRLGGDGVLQSVQRLMCEYGRHLLSRGWQYFPAELPSDVVAGKARNGRVVRELAIPLEDLQDGNVQSGQVGQEIYGAGLALVCATRFFHHVPGSTFLLFCEYPLLTTSDGRFRVAGAEDAACTLRLISTDPNVMPSERHIRIGRSVPKDHCYSVEGHLQMEVRGGDVITIQKETRRKKRRK